MKDFIRLPFDQKAASIAAEIFIHLRRSGKIIDQMDILIAATAIANKLPIATLNRKDFLRIPDLEVM